MRTVMRFWFVGNVAITLGAGAQMIETANKGGWANLLACLANLIMFVLAWYGFFWTGFEFSQEIEDGE